MDTQRQQDLIQRNTAEIVTEEDLQHVLKTKEKPVVYLGWSITGKPHTGYFIPVMKLADFLQAGLQVKILLADLHGALDNTPWDVLEQRYQYYAAIIPLMFEAVGADIRNCEIIKGSSFQLTSEYMQDLLRYTSSVSLHDSQRAASEVVKFGDSPRLSGMLYPLMQSLDEVYLNADIQYGGIDQRKILMFSREHLPQLGYQPRIACMTPLLPGLLGKKMSASDSASKIDVLDNSDTVEQKISDAYCPAGQVADNGIIAFVKHVVMPLKADRNEAFVVERPEKFGGPLSFNSYSEVEQAFVSGDLHPLDLKTAVTNEINQLLEPFHKQQTYLQQLAMAGYAEKHESDAENSENKCNV